MPKKSTIQTELTDEDRKALDRLIASDKLSLAGLLEWLGERGYDISRSALHRHVQKVEAVGAKLRETRQMTEALVQELGTDVVESDMGRLLVESMRSLAFDILSKKMDGDGEIDTKEFFFLAKGIKDLASSHKTDVDTIRQIKADAEKKAKEEAAARVKEVLKDKKAKGMSKETEDAIIDGILGRA